MKNETPPPHPGEILLHYFMDRAGVNQKELAEHCHISFQRVNEIVNGRRGITVDTAVLLAQAFLTTPEYWLDMQARYDICMALEQGVPKIAPLVELK